MNWVTSRRWLLPIALLTLVSTSVLWPLLARSVTASGFMTEQWLIGMRGGGPWGGRGGFCDIAGFAAFASSNSTGVVWNERPMFVWQGNLEWVEVRSADGQNQIQRLDLNQVNRDQPIHFVRLTETLQPGETYQIVLKAPAIEAFSPVLFQTMPAPERAQIAADLQGLDAAGGSAEAKALRQGDYFADRQLWADYWQTLLSVEQPSEALKATIESERKAICESPGAVS